MPYLAKAIFIFSSLVAATSSYSAELTEDTVKQVISRIDKAINNQNSAALAKELSTYASIKFNITLKGRKQAMTASKRRYISMLEQSWAQYSDYKYSRSNMTIDIKNNKALVSAVVQESMVFRGQKVSGSTKEEVTIELINGEPLVTKVIGHTRL